MTNHRRWLPLLLPILLLCACATAPSVGIEDPGARKTANAGYVAVQVVSNAETLGGPLQKWTALFLIEAKAGAEPLYLPSLESNDASTSVFVGTLPPGRYRLALLQAYQQVEDFSYRTRAAVPPFIGSFEIRTNHLTDLKTLIAQPLLPKTPTTEDTSDFIMTRADSGDDLERFVQQRLSKQFDALAPERLGWLADPYDALRSELHQVMVAHGLPRQTIRLSQQPAHDIFSFGRLGQYYLRKRDSREWTGAALPRPLEMFAATEDRRGIVMAGERGSLFRLDPASGTLTELPSPDGTGLAWDIEALGQTLLMTVQSSTHWTWYATDDDGKSWRVEHREAKKKPGIYFFSVNAPNQLRADNGGLSVWIEKKRLTRSPAGVWTEATTKTEWIDLIAQPNGVVVGRPYDWWSGAGDLQISRDGGQSWTSTKTGKWGILGPQSGNPYVFSDERLLMTGKSAKFNLVEGWTDLPTVPLQLHAVGKAPVSGYGQVVYGCDRLRGEISTDEEIFVLCKFGQLYASRDAGRTFELQFDPSLGVADTNAIIEKHVALLKAQATAKEPAE